MNQINNGKQPEKPKILIDIEIDDEIIPEGHLRIKDIKVLPKMQQRALSKSIEEIDQMPPEDQLSHLTDDFYVEQYRKMLKITEPPPVTVYKVNADLILVKGFNRLQASLKEGRKTIPAVVIQGTELDALRASCRANVYYRQELSNADKRCAFKTFYENRDEDESWTHRKMAGFFGLLDNSTIDDYVRDYREKKLENRPKKSSPTDNLRASYFDEFNFWANAAIPEYTKNSQAIIHKNQSIFSKYEIYNLTQCANEICIKEDEINRWKRTIERKHQAIIYGSPGTGKTFIAQKIAQHLISDSEGFSELVQFHPAYTYEDFIQGIRPQSQNGQLTYSIVPGRFLEFCKKAESRKGICVLIIDEINRANLAQVFGELMYLLEYRDKEIPLAGGNSFRIPSNVRIIGTMNTADRSIALVDHALRRRFAFIEIRPNYDVLRKYHEKRNTGFKVDGLIQVLQKLNLAIADKNYELGISFFLTEKLAEDIEDIWKMEIEPYLEEYFFDRLEKVDEFRWDKIEKQVLP